MESRFDAVVQDWLSVSGPFDRHRDCVRCWSPLIVQLTVYIFARVGAAFSMRRKKSFVQGLLGCAPFLMPGF